MAASVSGNLTIQGVNGGSKGRSLVGKIDDSSQISWKGVTVELGFSVDEFSASILIGKLTTVFLPVVYTMIFMVGLSSNGIALWVFLFRMKKHLAIVYIANLALADLLSIIWFPMKIAHHIHGNNWIYGNLFARYSLAFPMATCTAFS